jgi:hypothetical protein
MLNQRTPTGVGFPARGQIAQSGDEKRRPSVARCAATIVADGTG